jgi:hypothetical protein
MPCEIGERVVLRSLQWKVTDDASESYVELFGRENQGAVKPID